MALNQSVEVYSGNLVWGIGEFPRSYKFTPVIPKDLQT
jgi:hypothetical protein